MSQRNIFSAIDIRSDKIICLIAQELEIINRGKILQLIGIGISKLPVSCTKPLSLPHEEISNYIRGAIKNAENEAKVKISNVYVSISENMTSEYINFNIVNKNNLIGEDHIKDFFRSKLFAGLYTDSKEPLHSFPISYRIDNRKSVSEPIGMKAKNLLTKWHIILVSKNYLEIIYKTFMEMELNLKQIVSSNYSASLAVLTEEESDQGAITIEVQKNKTVLSYTFDSQLIGFDIIRIGTLHFTNDISQVKSVKLKEAESIRKKIDSFDKNKKQNKEIEKYYDIYLARAEELAKIILTTVMKSRFNALVSNSIILTGYGAKSIIIQKLIKNKFTNSSFRLGSTRKINGSKTFLDNPSLTSSFGLLSYATNHDLEGEASDENHPKKTILSTVYKFFLNL